GKYQGWYRINGATGYDINVTAYNDPTKGRDTDRTQLLLTGNEYTVETLSGAGTPTYQWSIVKNVTDETGELVSLGTDRTRETVELIFKSSILTKTDLVNNPSKADTIVLQCKVTDNLATHTLQRKITVGDRDECSPVAGLADAEGNRYTVSKFGGVCWMTQNLRSTYTMQGNLKQEISEDKNEINDYNAISYYYPYLSQTVFEDNPAYGLLYTWGAANIGTATTEAVNAFRGRSSDRQGICPDGWVIPSDYDFNQLEKEIATNPDLYSEQTDPFTWDEMYKDLSGWRPDEGNNITWWGHQMKSPTKVNNTATNGVSNTDGTGFNALLVGILEKGSNVYYSTYTYFWSGNAGNTNAAWQRGLRNSNSSVQRGTSNKYYLFSVRCKK
ncbi:MAG: fibrobacter succinogenes major paralogous domain-containing protein, partial [Dysgonamonadaceae bacterium]|nr:fibrobacter succinogenes major paralogous domain-containing protein [Dysgonamonadaceae bacterium]